MLTRPEPTGNEVAPARNRRNEDQPPRRGTPRTVLGRSTRRIALLGGLGLFLVVGVGVGGYYAFRSPQQPAQNEPLALEPQPNDPVLTPEQVVRKVKASTVYIRSHFEGDRTGSGTGFFAGKSGFVVTNAHVVGYGPRLIRVPEKIEVVIDSGEASERTFRAKLHSIEGDADLAILTIDAPDLPVPLPFGRAESLTEAQEVLVFGYPFGERLGKNVSVNRTTVSSLRREEGRLDRVQLAGGLNPGNSGGPVISTKGEVIGVSVSTLHGADAIAFAIPAEKADHFVADQIGGPGSIHLGELAALFNQELEGDYFLVGLEREGKPVAGLDPAKRSRLDLPVRITTDKIFLNAATDKAENYKIDGLKDPHHIDMTSKNQFGKVEKRYGIYRVTDDRLILCFVESEKPTERPKEFKTTADGKEVMMTLKKQLDR